MSEEVTTLRWFDAFAKCRCGKDSNGILRGDGNESYGAYCRKCAEKRLRKSDEARKRKERQP